MLLATAILLFGMLALYDGKQKTAKVDSCDRMPRRNMRLMYQSLAMDSHREE